MKPIGQSDPEEDAALRPVTAGTESRGGHRTEAPGPPLVSVIINNYNYSRFLSFAIDSALTQSYPHVEVLVVDDGSTDDSRQVIGRYGERVTAILKQNGGQASAMNEGFARSIGNVVLFLDADDALRPDIVARLVQTFCDSPVLGKAHFRLAVIDAAGDATGELKPPPHISMLDGDLRRHYLTFPDDVWRLPTTGNAFPRWALDQMMPIPIEHYSRTAADTYLTHVASLYGPVKFIDEVGGYYRIHGANNYEHEKPTLALDRVRLDIDLALCTHSELRRTAHALGLAATVPELGMLSTSFVINRLISLRLDPIRHPISGDSRLLLVRLGVRSVRRRFDVSPPMKAMYLAWIVLMVLAPRKLARRLAERLMFPQTRSWLGPTLRYVQRPWSIARGQAPIQAS